MVAVREKRSSATGPSSAADARARRFIRRAIILVVLILAWGLYVQFSGISPLLVPSPADVASSLWRNWSNGVLDASTVETLKLLGAGLGIGIAAGIGLSVLATFSQFGEDVRALLTAMVNPLPSIAILPVALIWFGLTPFTIIIIVANAVVWPFSINVSAGFRGVNPTLRAVGDNIGIRRLDMATDILIPSSLPYIIAGIETAWSVGWRTVVAAELVFGSAGGSGGLGYFIYNARFFLDVPGMFAGLVTIAIIGIIVDLLIKWAKRGTVVRWGMAVA